MNDLQEKRESFTNQDFRDAFLALLNAAVTKMGVAIADEAAYTSTCHNIEGLAIQAAKVLGKYPIVNLPAPSTRTGTKA